MNNPGESVFKSIVRNGNDGRYSGSLTPTSEAGLINLPSVQRGFITRAAELRAFLGEADAGAMVTVEAPLGGLNLSGTMTINGKTVAGASWTNRDVLITQFSK